MLRRVVCLVGLSASDALTRDLDFSLFVIAKSNIPAFRMTTDVTVGTFTGNFLIDTGSATLALCPDEDDPTGSTIESQTPATRGGMDLVTAETQPLGGCAWLKKNMTNKIFEHLHWPWERLRS